MEISKVEKDLLAEVGNIGAGHASTALSDLIGYKVNVTVPEASLVPTMELSESMRDDMAIGVYIPVSGDIEGGVLLLFPREYALKLSDILMGREIGSASEVSDMEESSLKEVGNILVGNCLTALSRFLNMDLVEDVPEIAKSSSLAILNSIASRMEQQADHALRIKEELSIEKEGLEIPSKFLLLLREEGAEKILKSVKEKDLFSQ